VLRSGARRETAGAVFNVLGRGVAGKFEEEARTQPASLRLANTNNVRSFAARSIASPRMKDSLNENGGLEFTSRRGGYRPESEFTSVAQHPVSTFSVDVDTAGYSSVRRFIQRGIMPPADAVCIEELLNYFSAQPSFAGADTQNETVPLFAARMEVAESPWTAGRRLVRIDVKARELPKAERRAANLVFLIDASGSMNAPNKLPLVQEALRRFLGRLRADDRIALVTYAGGSGRVLTSMRGSNAREIAAVLDHPFPAGSPGGSPGVQLAYDIAEANFVSDGINRVILCTDGTLDAGVTDMVDLMRLVEEKARSGVFLSVLGLGTVNADDLMLQHLADRGNGTYAHVDSRRGAEKMLSQQVNETLALIATDVELQVVFNPRTIESYRLIGYEKRRRENDELSPATIEAADTDAGHTVTALYEIVPIDRRNADVGTSESTPVEELKPAANRGVAAANLPGTAEAQEDGNDLVLPGVRDDLLTLKIRYKELANEVSKSLVFSLVDQSRRFSEASDDFKFAAAVAGFGMILRDSPHKGLATLPAVRSWAEAGGYDSRGYRAEFVDLVRRTEALQ
jgi:Ca-activated chloride channel family protein